MKTILHVIDTTGPGGAETIFIELADKLRQRGYDSVVVIRGTGWVYDELNHRGFDPIILHAKGSFNLPLLWSLIRIIRCEHVDIIQSHLLGSNLYCALAGIITNTPVVATFHGMVDVSSNEHFSRLKYIIMNIGIQRFVTVSRRLGDDIRHTGLLNPKKSTVIYNGIDFSLYGKYRRYPLKSDLHLPSNIILVGALGNVRPAKAYDLLIEAGSKVIKRYPMVHFVIAGHIKQPLMNELQKLMEKTETENNFHFLGYIENNSSFLSQLDIFILSSTSEGFSLATIEAMATGLPVIVTRCGGPEEIVTHGIDGWMVEARDAKALADGLIYILKNKKIAAKLAMKAMSSVRKKFSLDMMISQYLKLYEEIQN